MPIPTNVHSARPGSQFLTLLFGMGMILVFALFSGCTSKAVSSGMGGNAPKSVRVGFFSNIAHAQALVGRAQGSFEEALGLPVDWKLFNAGSAEIEAFMANELDLGYIGPGPAINAFRKTQGALVVIAGASEGGTVLVARADSDIHSVHDLTGKLVSVPQYGSTQDLLLRALLSKNRLKASTQGGTVEIAQVNNADVRMLFEQNSLDAALVPEPWGARLEKEAHARLILDEKQVWKDGHYPAAVVVVRKAFADAHPQLVQQFVNEHVRLSTFIHEHPEETLETVNRQLLALTYKKLPTDVLKAAFRRIVIDTHLTPKRFKDIADLSVSSGYYRESPDLSGLINTAFLQAVSVKDTQEGLAAGEKPPFARTARKQ